MGTKVCSTKDKKQTVPSFPQEPEYSSTIAVSILNSIISDALKKIEETKTELSSSDTTTSSISEVNIIKTKSKPKKEKNFFLYPTHTNTSKKKKDNKKYNNNNTNTNPISFYSKLSNDIDEYNKKIDYFLLTMKPIKEHFISQLKHLIYNALSNYFPYFDLELYGSYITELDIESSDIDLMFTPKNKLCKINSAKLMSLISDHFYSLNIFENINPIFTASIPVIKLIIRPEIFLHDKQLISKYIQFKSSNNKYNYNINEIDLMYIDISFPYNNFDRSTPSKQVTYIKETIQKDNNKSYEMTIIIKIMKRLLKTTGLNNTYLGGFGSYMMFLLTYAFNKFYYSNKNTKKKQNEGKFLYEMIKFYAGFSFTENIIDVTEDFPFLQYSDDNVYDNVPLVIDPVTMLNVSRSAFNYDEVVEMFSQSVEILNELKNKYDNTYNEVKDVNFIEELMKMIIIRRYNNCY